jgi:hypothetical protein
MVQAEKGQFVEKEAQMKRTSALVVLLVAFAGHGEAKPMPKDQLDCVKAGEVKTFVVELEKATTFSGGRLQLLVGPFDEQQSDRHPWCENNLCRSSTVDFVPGKKKYTMSIQIPGEAPNGIWVAFIGYALPNSDFTDITPKKRVRFQVVENLGRLCPEMKRKVPPVSLPCVKVAHFASVP